MELKIFRDTLPQAGTSCTVKAELPLETEILISDYLPPVFKLVKCFAKPVVLQKQLQPGKLTLEGYLRCIVYYQGEDDAGLCQTEQKLPFNKVLELPEFAFTAWTAQVEGQTEYLNCRSVTPRRIEVRGAFGLVASVYTQQKTEVLTALADGGIEQQLTTLEGVRRAAVLDKLITVEGELVSSIGPGFMVLVGSEEGDTDADVKFIAGKIAGMRIFEDADDKLNLSIKDVGGEVLLVSQFTLLGDARHGRRPSFSHAAAPEIAEPLVEKLRDELIAAGIPTKTGRFRTHMKVLLENDGPVTIMLDSHRLF